MMAFPLEGLDGGILYRKPAQDFNLDQVAEIEENRVNCAFPDLRNDIAWIFWTYC
jgi:hypothetical protein